jgi:hypothetical protein
MIREMPERLLSNSGGHGFGQSEEGEYLKFSSYWQDNKTKRLGHCPPACGSSALKALDRAPKKGEKVEEDFLNQ